MLTKKKLKTISPVTFFVIVTSIFGVFFLLATPPFQTPDEGVHFYRAYQISEGNFVPDYSKGVSGGYLPKSLAETVGLTTQSHAIEFHPDVKYNLHATKAALSIKENASQKQQYDLSNTATYSAIAYIPQTIGVLAGRLLDLPPEILMYLGRTTNLIAWIILFSFAIRLMPYKKWALVAVGLLPMMTFQSISLGVDVMVVGLSALIIAVILRAHASQTPLSNRTLLALVALFAGLVLTKPVMFVLLPLALLVPLKQYASTKRVAILKETAVIAVPFLCFVAWSLITKKLSVSSTPSPFNPQPSAQVSFILHDPFGYLQVLWKTYFFTNSDGIARSFIGTFGWVDAPVSEYFATLGYITLGFLMLANYKPKLRDVLSRRDKLVLAGVALAYALVVTTALYVYYSPVHFKFVIGVQGRYYIPFALLLIPLLRGDWLRVSPRHYKLAATTLPVFMLTVSAITLFYRYYVHA